MFGMDWKEMLINQLIGLASGFLLIPSGAAKYLKLIIRLRDYLLMLAPVEAYPVGSYKELSGRKPEDLMIKSDAMLLQEGSASLSTKAGGKGKLELRLKPRIPATRRAVASGARGTSGTKQKRR